MGHVFSLCLCISLLCVGSVTAASPPGTLTFVSAAQAGLMKGIGVLNPHAYRPTEFPVQNWVYEGLVHYGEGGKILPALAESWKVGTRGSQQDITFNLRRQAHVIWAPAVDQYCLTPALQALPLYCHTYVDIVSTHGLQDTQTLIALLMEQLVSTPANVCTQQDVAR